MDPDKRNLIKVSIDDAAEAERLVTTLMGDDIEARKQYINQHANFDKEDEFYKNYSKVNTKTAVD